MPNIEAHITGNVWKIQVKVGDEVSEDDEVIILESITASSLTAAPGYPGTASLAPWASPRYRSMHWTAPPT